MNRKHKYYLQNAKKIKYKGYKLRTKQCLSLTKLRNKTFLHTSTKWVRSSEIFRTSYPLFSIVVFRETTSTVQTISVLFFFSSVASSVKRTTRSCPNVMECQTELDLGKPFSSVFLKDQEEHSTQADWFWI